MTNKPYIITTKLLGAAILIASALPLFAHGG
jgi:hypothetical protein